MSKPSERDIAERDQLWASLRVLQEEIENLAVAPAGLTDRQQQVARVLARIVIAELDYRARHAEPD